MGGYFHMWSVHKNTNNKTSIAFFGLEFLLLVFVLSSHPGKF